MPAVRGKNIEVLFPAEAIASRNLELASQIASCRFEGLLVVSVLKGSFIFAADLIRAMHGAGLAPEIEFILVSSYGAGTTSGEVKVLRDIDASVAGRDVLVIDDILESGKTLKFTRDLFLGRGARSVRIAVLLDKRGRRQIELEADFVGFECPDRFVVGYGMDAWPLLPRASFCRGDRGGRRVTKAAAIFAPPPPLASTGIPPQTTKEVQHHAREKTMAESVYKIIELVGTSTELWEKAAAAAIERAGKSLRDLRIAEVAQLDMQIADGKVEAYRAKVKVSFKYEGD